MITGGRILTVKGSRTKDVPTTGLNVNLNVDEVKKEKGKTVITYKYLVKYAPDAAELEVTGEVYVEGNEEKEVEESWKKSKQLPEKFTEELLTAISYTGTAVGTLLAFALNITAPINMPRVKIQAPGAQQAG